MGRVISTLDRAQKDGHCHALLESPTGTGKSLSLLCSALAWQQHFRSKNLNANLCHSNPNPMALSDPLAHGGGFIPETQPSSMPASENIEPSSTEAKSKNQKKKKMAPTIFYASRTHSQISQVIREYRKTVYRVPMAILASRKHYCTNARVRGYENIDEECKLILKNQDVGCVEFKNLHKVKGHPSLQKGGCHEAHDIEDLVKVGQVVRGCSYFAARSMAEDAQLVFCPYGYIVNRVIRKAMDIDIKGAILILDEAHNIEDMAREAGSVDIEEDALHKLQMELGQLCLTDREIYQPLFEMIQDIISWMERRKGFLQKREFQHYFSCWTGDKALRELQDASVSHQCFPILQECATKAIKAATDAELEATHLSGLSVITLEELFSSLTYFFSGNGIHINDYQLALQRYIPRDAANATGTWVHTFSLWCLNPAVVFREIADLSLSLILTSGTLSPMNSFSSELGVQFGTCLEAPHVIDVESQLWAAVVSTGPGNYPLNASYKTADGYAFQDALGTTLEEICKIVPGGCLVFFPSYKLMEKLCNRWRETGQWSRLNAGKPLFIEPRAGSQEDFESTLKSYYDCIHQGTKPAVGRKKKGKRMNRSVVVESQDNLMKGGGAAFLAVCRGKVSEGIDFSDENARMVIVVGIPFPNVNDVKVAQKKKYNDTYKSSKNLLSGSEWYCHQAFRALNQAAGRCIRHRFDYGAIVLLDQRFQEERNTAYISKWLRKSIRQVDSLDRALEGLKSFFSNIEERVRKTTNGFQSFNLNVENIPSTCQNKGFTRNKDHKLSEFDRCGQKNTSNNIAEMGKNVHFFQSLPFVTKCDANFSQIKSQGQVRAVVHLQIDEEKSSCRKCTDPENDFTDSRNSKDVEKAICIDLEDDFKKDSRCSKDIDKVFSYDSPELSIVKETLCMDSNFIVASPQSLVKDENSTSTMNQAYTEFPDKVLHSTCLGSSGEPLSKATSSLVVTPERCVTANMTPEIEYSLNFSVNSHAQKRKRLSPLVSLNQAELSDAIDANTLGHLCHAGSSVASEDADCKTELYSEHKFKHSNVPQLLSIDGVSCVSSVPVMDKRLQIFCLLCRNPLGLSANQLYVTCSLTSMSKNYLASLLDGRVEPPSVKNSTSIPIVISDVSSIDQLLCNKAFEGVPGQGVWCEEDGCVFNTIFCPFCSVPNNCLGVRIMATDATNVQLLNKILFFSGKLEIINPETLKDEDLSSVSGSNLGEIAVVNSIEKFSYSPQHQKSEGWRTTKSKLRLPKRGTLSVLKR